jgi:hypothetical protein
MKNPWKRLRSQRKTWGGLVGRFVLAFGDIENVTYMALAQIPRDAIFKSTSTLGFGKRADLVAELVQDHPEVSEAARSRLVKYLKEAKTLSETRNTLAHSPLMLKLYTHPQWTHAELGIASVRNREKPITLTILRQSVRKAETLSAKLYRAYSRVYKSIDGAKAT